AWFGIYLFLFALLQSTAAQQEPTPAVARGVTGRVIDSFGEPIEHAAIQALEQATAINTKALLETAPCRSQADGTFALELPHNYIWSRIVVAKMGYQSLSHQISQNLTAEGGKLGEVLLPPAGQLIGRVRDAQNQPLEGVQLNVTSSIVDHWSYQATIQAGGTCNDKGIFVVPCVPRTGLSLTASKHGYATVKDIVSQGSAFRTTSRMNNASRQHEDTAR